MEPEDLFRLLMQSFDVHDHVENPEWSDDDWYKMTIRETLSPDHRLLVKKYLKDLLSGKYNERQIEKIYYQAQPRVHWIKGKLVGFLTRIRDLL